MTLWQTSAWNPYAGLPWWVQAFFALALFVTVFGLVDVIVLRAEAGRTRRRLQRDEREAEVEESDFLWVFLVPALNEEVTIADSVSRLSAVEVTHKLALVIDDGSDDRTPEILAGLDEPMVRVLRRDPPDARRGKAAALNAAWHHLHEEILTRPEHAHRTTDRVIVVIVDADGRLDPVAPAYVVRHLGDPRVGGVQIQVRIYNRQRVLAWAQDVEFSIFGHIYQLGRAAWGTANMGGNGQFNRLAALDDVAEAEGPWRHRLTEDQDVGLRLIAAGWRGSHEADSHVAQQGLSQFRPLFRQRTRWAQGGWQAFGLIPTVWRARVPVLARVDMVGYLLAPLLQLVTAGAFLAAVALAVFDDVPFISSAWPVLVFFAGTTFGSGLIALLARERGWRALVFAVLLLTPYICYTWMNFPTVLRALGRQVSGKGSWAKTAREPIAAPDPAVEAELPQ